jgi:hypothetical protein
MRLDIWLYFAVLSPSITVRELEGFDVEHSREASFDGVPKCDLQPAGDKEPIHIAFDVMRVQLDTSVLPVHNC